MKEKDTEGRCNTDTSNLNSVNLGWPVEISCPIGRDLFIDGAGHKVLPINIAIFRLYSREMHV